MSVSDPLCVDERRPWTVGPHKGKEVFSHQRYHFSWLPSVVIEVKQLRIGKNNRWQLSRRASVTNKSDRLISSVAKNQSWSHVRNAMGEWNHADVTMPFWFPGSLGFPQYSSTSSLSSLGSLMMQWLQLKAKRCVSTRHNPQGDGRREETIRRNKTPLWPCKTRIHGCSKGCSVCPLATKRFSC